MPDHDQPQPNGAASSSRTWREDLPPFLAAHESNVSTSELNLLVRLIVDGC